MKLRLINDPVLREPTTIVDQSELDYIKSLIPEMTTIMNEEGGIGLAANQVGISKRFFIMKRNDIVEVIINPEIVDMGDLEAFNEACLSIPGTRAETLRARSVTLRYKDLDFSDKEENFNEIEAVAIQHEIDHLDGKLYVDQLQPMRRKITLDRSIKFIKMGGRNK